MLEETRGRAARTGCVQGLLSGHWCEQVEGKCDDNKEVYFVDKILTVQDTNNFIVKIKL